jgi:uncharacterized protein (DUF2267 family)
MQQDALVALVAEESGTAPDAAERVLRATLETLGQRLSLGVARRIARCLPPPARGWIVDGPAPERFDADEFVRRVAERTGVDAGTAQRHARAGFAALAKAADQATFAAIRAELPRDIIDRLAVVPQRGRARSHGAARPLSRDAFVAAVAEREQVSRDAARGHARAVLTTLFELFGKDRTPGVAAQLPDDFAPLLGPASAR